jgi:hypothetical protein
MSAAPSVALVPYLGSGEEGVAARARLAPEDVGGLLQQLGPAGVDRELGGA